MLHQTYSIPVIIITIGALIAAGLFLYGNGATQIVRNEKNDNTATVYAAAREENPYILGNPDAPVKIVEFSDFECPFCAQLHPTLERLINEADGQIAWEYRHLPLPSHRNAEEAAYAGECIGQLGGNDAFWDFANNAFKNQRALNDEYYVREASRLGVDLKQFNTCFESEETKQVVQQDRQAAVSNGGRGTPFSVIVFPDGSTQPVSGALPYENWSSLLQIQN